MVAIALKPDDRVGQSTLDAEPGRNRNLDSAVRCYDRADTLMIETNNRRSGCQCFEHNGARRVSKTRKCKDVRPAELRERFMVRQPSTPPNVAGDAPSLSKFFPLLATRPIANDVEFVRNI